MEVWRTIEGFENYKVSNYGNIKNKTTKRMLNQELCRGYFRVSLSKNSKVTRFQVHRLVANAFYWNYLNKKCVNHINGIKTDNNKDNLEWCSYSENERHSYDFLGKVNPIRKLKENDILDIRQNCKKANTKNVILFPGNVNVFMLKYNVSRKTILNVLNNKYYV